MKVFPFTDLERADLLVDACYSGGRAGNAGDAPLPKLLRVDNQGGFRYRGRVSSRLEMLVLYTKMDDPDWPDALDEQTGLFTYYGDNKKPGRELHDTGRDGNLILQRIFASARSGLAGRLEVPPVFLFRKTGPGHDATFLGLAVPGSSDLDSSEELVAVWRSSKGERFQNYRAKFTVLDAGVIGRPWLDSIIAGQRDDSCAPPAWQTWIKTGRRKALIATRSLEHRSKDEQLPKDAEGERLISIIRSHFEGRSHSFEHFAAALARLMMPEIASLDVTRASRDGGRDAIGQLRIGTGASAILMDFALEAKCYGATSSVGVREMSRLISRLRHRQFGVIVTTSHVDLQAYKEIKEDQHPIVVIAAVDIADLLRRNGKGHADTLLEWLSEEFATEESQSDDVVLDAGSS